MSTRDNIINKISENGQGKITGAVLQNVLLEMYDEHASLGNNGAQGTQGNKGQQGQQGKSGDIGTQGFGGNQGIDGNQGIEGDQGRMGSQGRNGYQGKDGEQGEIGPQGKDGKSGSQGTQGNLGLTGSQGADGNQGKDGNQGTQGNKGNQGEKGEAGFSGSQGAQGNQGVVGSQGSIGSQGNQGNQGKQGEQGLKGLDGSQGDRGINGLNGIQGNQGVQGDNGQQGLQGDVIMPVFTLDNDNNLYVTLRINGETICDTQLIGKIQVQTSTGGTNKLYIYDINSGSTGYTFDNLSTVKVKIDEGTIKWDYYDGQSAFTYNDIYDESGNAKRWDINNTITIESLLCPFSFTTSLNRVEIKTTNFLTSYYDRTLKLRIIDANDESNYFVVDVVSDFLKADYSRGFSKKTGFSNEAYRFFNGVDTYEIFSEGGHCSNTKQVEDNKLIELHNTFHSDNIGISNFIMDVSTPLKSISYSYDVSENYGKVRNGYTFAQFRNEEIIQISKFTQYGPLKYYVSDRDGYEYSVTNPDFIPYFTFGAEEYYGSSKNVGENVVITNNGYPMFVFCDYPYDDYDNCWLIDRKSTKSNYHRVCAKFKANGFPDSATLYTNITAIGNNNPFTVAPRGENISQKRVMHLSAYTMDAKNYDESKYRYTSGTLYNAYILDNIVNDAISAFQWTIIQLGTSPYNIEIGNIFDSESDIKTSEITGNGSFDIFVMISSDESECPTEIRPTYIELYDTFGHINNINTLYSILTINGSYIVDDCIRIPIDSFGSVEGSTNNEIISSRITITVNYDLWRSLGINESFVNARVVLKSNSSEWSDVTKKTNIIWFHK